MQPLVRFLVASALLLAATTTARAQPGATRVDAATVAADSELDFSRPVAPAVETVIDTKVVEERYGLQILAVDAAAISMAFVAGAADSDALGYGALLTGLVGPAVVHGMHGNPGRLALSVGARLVLPYGGALIGSSAASCGDGEFLCGLGEAAMGFALGYLAAATIDVAMAVETRTVTRTKSVAWTPTVTRRGDGFQVGVAATF